MENMINVAGLLSDEELAAIAGGQRCEDCTTSGDGGWMCDGWGNCGPAGC